MILPPKLKTGDEVRVIAPSCTLPSLKWLTEEFLDEAKKFFTDLGMTVSEGKHLREIDEFDSTKLENRLEDLHDAFRDPKVKMVITIRGGWNCNQLLPYLDYDLIKKNPKILCGFSDITALSNAIYAKTGLVGYSGQNFYSFCIGDQLNYTFDYFKKCVMEEGEFEVLPSKQWSNDRFTADHRVMAFEENKGWWNLNPGKAEGTLVGGNLCTLQLLQGTEYMPSLKDSVVFAEDDYECTPQGFDRDLESLTQQPDFDSVRGLVIGRFEKAVANKNMSPMSKNLLTQIVKSKKKLSKIPVIANVDFGHTNPIFTFPVGGTVKVSAKEKPRITIMEH